MPFLAVRLSVLQDWIALLLCAYIVGLQVCGEIKDTALCEMAMQRNLKELSLGWQIGLKVLNRLRAQFFLAPLMGVIPGVILTQVTQSEEAHDSPPISWLPYQPLRRKTPVYCR
eukprot:SAG22_NODE_550_length_9202_cov_30.666484_4_plen_114_part_00